MRGPFDRPWDSQPQETVGVDWGNPLTRGLQMLLLPTSGGLRDVVNPSAVWTPNGNAKIEPTQRGFAAVLDGVDDYWSCTGYPQIAGATGTLFILAASTGADDTNGSVWFGTNTTTSVYFQTKSTVNGSYIFAQNVLGTANITNSTNTSIVFSSGVNRVLFVNGVSTVSAVANATAFAAGSKSFRLGAWNGGATWDVTAKILAVGYSSKAWSAAEAAEFYNNPWQLFEPQRIFIQEAAAGASFNPAWAVGSNAIVGAGAHAS